MADVDMKMSIHGMHCEGCVRRVKAALEGLASVEVKSVEVGSAEIMHDEAKVPKAVVFETLREIGFDVHAA